MNISILGLGYVGTVSAACFARNGHRVIGVDPVPLKVEAINQGRSPIIEPELADIIREEVRNAAIRATDDVCDAVLQTDISFICVGTPCQPNGSLDLQYVRRAAEGIGLALKEKERFHTVAMRSTVLPGTVRNVVIPILENCSGKRCGKDFGVCMNPEFMREGSAVADFYDPPKTIIGEDGETQSGEILALLYEQFDAPLLRTTLELAEMLKYVDNAWHALKIGFANEIGNFSKELGMSGHQVMDMMCLDRKLNISSAYLKPGFAFGGSCLPKDLRALNYKADSLGLNLPILQSILPGNRAQVERAFRIITRQNRKMVGILGMSFKPDTDDLRESPLVELIERLIGAGYNIRVYDRNVKLASLFGSNRNYILNLIPHISKILVDDIGELFEHAETIVIGNADPEFPTLLKKHHTRQFVLDLTGMLNETLGGERYEDFNC